jgi:UDP-N-acetylglucosamine pyrophosphorylase
MYQYCVDNILIKMVDPVFLGFLYESGADVGCKVAPKVSASVSSPPWPLQVHVS